MTRGAVPVLLLAAAVGLAGCAGLGTVGPTEDPVCQVVEYPLLTLPVDGGDGTGAARSGDPRQPWDALVRATPDDAVDVTVPPWAPDEPAVAAIETLGAEGNLSRVRATEPAPASEPDGSDHPRVTVRWSDGETCGRRGDANWHLDPVEGEVASPGQGVHVYTAGFWENGTLFYTNMQSVHDSDWPRGGGYAFESADPLPVYVYDEDPDERPAHWGVSAQDPVLGESVTAWEYYPTIPGFNEALKGLSSTTSRVVHMPPEQGYTRPGYEDHPLYGDALIFYLFLTDVVDRPCWTEAAGDALCPVVG